MESNMVAGGKRDTTLEALKWLVAGLIIAYVLSLYIGRIDLNLPFRTYVVQSGSMEPAIMTGDLILIRPSLSYTQHQVVTFKDDQDRVVTHRIIESENTEDGFVFVTKGDANPSFDVEKINLNQIVGRVALVIPKLGYLVSFGKTRWGSLFFVIIPAVVIIYDEYRDMKRKLK
ncbi:signal peptidase I [Patescibacteria group bacterium]|nr:signal peptidase I [Patescibacteria group bacterium]